MMGLAFLAGSAILVGYGVSVAFTSARRLRRPVALVVGRDGFQAAGSGPVGWDEVATVGDPASPPGRPKIVRVQLADPAAYLERHRMGAVGRLVLAIRGHDLFLGSGMGMPVAELEALMRERLAEYRRTGASRTPAVRPLAGRNRRRRGGRR
jgi:hypothetical protein